MTINNPLHAEIVTLRQRLDEREEEIRQLRGNRDLGAEKLARQFRLTVRESKLLALLASGDRVFPNWAILEHCQKGDERNPKMVNVVICHVRRKIAPLKITNHWGRGYALEGQSRAAVRAAMKGVA